MSYIPGIGSNGFTTPADYKAAQTNSKTQTSGTEDLKSLSIIPRLANSYRQ